MGRAAFNVLEMATKTAAERGSPHLVYRMMSLFLILLHMGECGTPAAHYDIKIARWYLECRLRGANKRRRSHSSLLLPLWPHNGDGRTMFFSLQYRNDHSDLCKVVSLIKPPSSCSLCSNRTP